MLHISWGCWSAFKLSFEVCHFLAMLSFTADAHSPSSATWWCWSELTIDLIFEWLIKSVGILICFYSKHLKPILQSRTLDFSPFTVALLTVFCASSNLLLHLKISSSAAFLPPPLIQNCFAIATRNWYSELIYLYCCNCGMIMWCNSVWYIITLLHYDARHENIQLHGQCMPTYVMRKKILSLSMTAIFLAALSISQAVAQSWTQHDTAICIPPLFSLPGCGSVLNNYVCLSCGQGKGQLH